MDLCYSFQNDVIIHFHHSISSNNLGDNDGLTQQQQQQQPQLSWGDVICVIHTPHMIGVGLNGHRFTIAQISIASYVEKHDFIPNTIVGR